MYLATPPAVPATASADSTPVGQLPLPLARIITRTFDKCQPYGAMALRIVEDLAVSYAVPHARDDFAARRRTTFTDMVKALADELTDGEEEIGLVVLAHGLPDAEPQWPACYLSHVLPGQPLSFAVADNGVVTPYLAMRIAAEYIRADGVRRAVVLILEQTSLLCDPTAGVGVQLPNEDRLVALVFDRTGTLGTASVSMAAGVDGEAAHETLRRHLDFADGSSRAVVAGGGFAAEMGATAGGGIALAGAGMPCTGPWIALLERLDGWRSAGVRQVRVLDYDPSIELLGECVIDLPGA